jgi:predicted dehydrogenase
VTTRIPVGVIGVGALGRHHARHLSLHPGVQLVGVYDAAPARAAEIASQVGTEAFAELEALLDRVRGVSIAAPTSFHHGIGVRVLERGIGILMEKPVTVTVAEADDLIARAGAAGVPLQVGQIERFNRAVRAAEPAVCQPRFIECERLAPFSVRGSDVSVVLDLMVHDIDLALHLTGNATAVDVRADGGALLSSSIDLANARIEFAGGAVASITASRLARSRVRRTRIYQADGYLSLDLTAGTAEFTRLRRGWRPGQTAQSIDDVVERITLTAPESDALGLEIGHFVDALAGRTSGGVPGTEGRAALALARQVEDAVARAPIVPAAR